MTRKPIERTIAADPTSTALLVAAVARTPRADVRGVSVRAEATLRTAEAFVTRFELRLDDEPGLAGVLTLAAEPGPGPTTWTRASVRIDAPVRDDSLHAVVVSLLADLARAAELRSLAA
ncbi:MAG TPA: hypothetical protein VNA12_00740 [Mycobacteriales bacterium]|nr:hypothetical protein [Mycobacteriales bacterium]